MKPQSVIPARPCCGFSASLESRCRSSSSPGKRPKAAGAGGAAKKISMSTTGIKFFVVASNEIIGLEELAEITLPLAAVIPQQLFRACLVAVDPFPQGLEGCLLAPP